MGRAGRWADLSVELANAQAAPGVTIETPVPATYRVQTIHSLGTARVEALRTAIDREIAAIGLHASVEITVDNARLHGAPTVAVFLGDEVAVTDPACVAAADAAVADVITVLPVVDDLNRFRDLVPPILHPINGIEWADAA